MRSANGHYTVTSPVPREVWESLYRSDEKAVVSQSLAWRDPLLRTLSRLATIPRMPDEPQASSIDWTPPDPTAAG